MIPFASQRGGGQDLATHLLNENENDYVELVDLRGSIAQDLHGAFAEWEVQASTLTKCENYLYSLSINPDPRQGQITRELYLEYLCRVETKLGLEQQGRAVVCHIKNGREHFHAVYSRIDAVRERAVHLAFDKEKLMLVTRTFAREHNIELPKGYFKGKNTPSREQLSLYEKHQQETTGVTKEERKAIVTECWKHCDDAKSLVAALAAKGYILATGNRPYLLVDIYGNVNSLPKLIDTRLVNTNVVRNLLKKEYPIDSLPHVDDVKMHVNLYFKQYKEFKRDNAYLEKIEELKASQKYRRNQLDRLFHSLKSKQAKEKTWLDMQVFDSRAALKSKHLVNQRSIRALRRQRRLSGLANFLGKVTGTNLVLRKLQKHQDITRHRNYLEKRDILDQAHNEQSQILTRNHEMQLLELQRQMRALDQVEKRELKALHKGMEQSHKLEFRKGLEHLPTFNLSLSPPGRKAYLHKAKNRYTRQETNSPYDSVYGFKPPKDNSLKQIFTKSAEKKTKNNPIYKKTHSSNNGRRK